jgi:hypothetical protein
MGSMKKLTNILVVFLVVLIAATIFLVFISDRKSDDINQITEEKNRMESELESLQKASDDLKYQLLSAQDIEAENENHINRIDELEGEVENLSDQLQNVSENLESLQVQSYYLGTMDNYFGMYEDYIQSLVIDGIDETCILPKFINLGDEIVGLEVSSINFGSLFEDTRVFDGYSIELSGELTVDAMLIYNEYYGEYGLLVDDLGQIPHTPRDVNMYILLADQSDFFESTSYTVGDILTVTISDLLLSYASDKPKMNSAILVDIVD